jgi:hypothetical protein
MDGHVYGRGCAVKGDRVSLMSVKIERLRPRRKDEEPVLTGSGYELVDQRVSGQKNKVENSAFVRSIDEAAYLIEQGFAIRMGAPGLRPSLISQKSLRIIRS